MIDPTRDDRPDATPREASPDPQASPPPSGGATPPPPTGPTPAAAAPQGQGALHTGSYVDPRDPRIKSPVLASILSAVPGLGQIYVGYYVRGFVHAIVVAALISIAISLDPYGQSIAPIVALFTVFFWLYNIIDAGRKASLYNLALQGKAIDIDLPSDFTMPPIRGSVGVGILLVAFGVVLLLHTRWQVSLEWVEEWWPLLPIGLGVWLIVRALQDRARE